MKVLITGGAGFIGSSVCDRLLALEHQVLVIDNYFTGRKENNQLHPNLKFIEGTIIDDNLVKNAFSDFKPDVVLHAAASFKNPDDWKNDINTNILGTINIINSSKLYNLKKVVYLQTSLCYGINPIKTSISLTHPLFGGMYSGVSSYAISKTSGEQYLELSGQKFISLRLANVYGPRNLSGPLPAFFYRLSNNMICNIVDSRRDFIFIDDVVDVIIKALTNAHTGYYHVSTGKDFSIKELFDLVLKYMNLPDKINYNQLKLGEDDAPTILLVPSKTNNEFDWVAKTTLEEGVIKTIDWYKKNGLSEIFSHLKNIN